MTQNSQPATLDGIPTTLLKAGTPLWHGTDCEGDFLHPDGPAWFAFSLEDAQKWSGWSQSVPEGRAKGERRVLAFEAARDVVLLDTSERTHWEALCEAATGDPEGSPWGAAAALAQRGLAEGWYGRTEILLVAPSAALVPKGCVWTDGPDAAPFSR